MEVAKEQLVDTYLAGTRPRLPSPSLHRAPSHHPQAPLKQTLFALLLDSLQGCARMCQRLSVTVECILYLDWLLYAARSSFAFARPRSVRPKQWLSRLVTTRRAAAYHLCGALISHLLASCSHRYGHSPFLCEWNLGISRSLYIAQLIQS